MKSRAGQGSKIIPSHFKILNAETIQMLQMLPMLNIVQAHYYMAKGFLEI